MIEIEEDDFFDDIDDINSLPEWKAQINHQVSEDYYYSLIDDEEWCEEELNKIIKDAEDEYRKNERKESINRIYHKQSTFLKTTF